jgi:hypothetical protein
MAAVAWQFCGDALVVRGAAKLDAQSRNSIRRRVVRRVRDASDLVDGDDKGQALAGCFQIRSFHSLRHYPVDLMRMRQSQDDLLLGLDGDDEELLTLVDAGSTAEQNSCRRELRP